MTDQQMIDRLGFDPGDPRNDLTTGFGSGRPTDRTINGIANFLGNAAFPGLGKLTGPAAQGIYDMISHGASRAKVQNAIAQATSGTGGDVSVGGLEDVTGNGPGGGSQGSPFGGLFSGLPAGWTETNRFGGGAPNFTYQGSQGPDYTDGSIFGGTTNFNPNPMGGQVVSSSVQAPGGWGGSYGGYGGGLAPGMANLYLHSAPMQSWAQNQGYNSVGDWLNKTGFSLAGGNPSGANLSGAGRPMTSSR
jgi:hypothetical protein